MSYALNIAAIPLALYIHIPWCVKKCPYCDFNSHQLPSTSKAKIASQFTTYVDALIADIIDQKKFVQSRTITSIFIGGGTPSLLPIDEFKRLFAALDKHLPLAKDIEVTLEANPGTLEHAPFRDYLDIGINRLSVGVQTFNNAALTQLGRIHNSVDALSAISQARQAGFSRVNVDLMHGLPQQTTRCAVLDIQQAHDAGATHLSWYQLTIEPNTVFYRDTPVLPSDDNLAEIEQQGGELLTTLGYQNYEVSAWVGKEDIECRHNVNYWQFGDYLAIGAGAHGKVSLHNLEGLNGIYRFSKSRMPKDYVRSVSVTSKLFIESTTPIAKKPAPKMIGFDKIDKSELCGEFMMNALRLNEGFEIIQFTQRTGLPYTVIKDTLTKLKGQGLISIHTTCIKPTPLGRRYINRIIQDFL